VGRAPENWQDHDLPLEEVGGHLEHHLVAHRPLLTHQHPPLLHGLPLRPRELASLHRVVGRLHQLRSELGVGGSDAGNLVEPQLVKKGVEHARVALAGCHRLTWRDLEVDISESDCGKAGAL